METIEIIRLACYVVNIISSFILGVFFIREFSIKRLRASLAWGLGFILFGITISNLAFMAAAEVSKPAVYIGFAFTAIFIALLYYGASLLFFKERSFWREKMTVIWFFAVLLVGLVLTYFTPAEQITQAVRGPSLTLTGTVYFVIAILFYQVSRRIPKEDTRRRTITLVSAGWWMILIWNIYLALFFGEHLILEAFAFLLGSLGFLLLLYGMTTGKTAER